MADVPISLVTAMASAFVKPVMEKCGDAVSKTDSAAGLKSALLGNLNPKLVELQKELTILNGLLSLAETLNPDQCPKNELLSPWLKKIKEAANFAENLLEEISYYQLQRQVEESSKVGQLFRASDGTSIAFRHKIGSKVNKFKAMAADIHKDAAKINPSLKFVEITSSQPAAAAKPAMSTNLSMIRENVDTSIIVGRQPDEDLIVGELRRQHNEEVLGVIALVGMSGVGKTALAKNIYENETVKEIYKKKTWIYVSQKFDLKRVLNEMLQSVTGVNLNLSNIDTMESNLRGCLEREKYLLVLDDVRNTDEVVWGTIRSSLERATAGCTDSKVLVTTQSSQVASVMGAYLTHPVEVLSNDDALELFNHRAFANKKEEEVSELRGIGERILRKCGGLPLAINTLASLLKSKNKSQWEQVEKDSVWKSYPHQINNIMPWLQLSFNHLPDHETKRCFGICSILIPKGTAVTEESLIQSWIAHGFIHPTSDNPEMIDNVQYLHDRNLLQSVKNEGQTWFTIHDLMRDLSLYVSMDSCLNISDAKDLPKDFDIVEHVSIDGCNSALDFLKGNTKSPLRTLICVNAAISIDLVAQARFMRQLHLNHCGLTEIPSSIGGLKLLRILDLQDNPFKYLPAAIGKLYNLRTLYLKGCLQLVELPQEVTHLINLRMLAMEHVYILEGMGQLTRLTHLPVVKLKTGDGCKIKELGNLQHLRGNLRIEQLENISSKEEAEGARLENKKGIADLTLTWRIERGEDIVGCNDEEVMEGLKPHSELKALRVGSFYGQKFSSWLQEGLYCTSLTRLVLVCCTRCEQLPTLGWLENLKFLSIVGMKNVEVIGIDFYCRDEMSQGILFPSLKELDLVYLQKLKEWVEPSGSGISVEVFPCLEKLFIQNCPSLVWVPTCFQSLKQLTVEGINNGEPLQTIVSNSDKLTSLKVKNVEHLTSLAEPLLNCTSLQLLEIQSCKILDELPSSLTTLRCLETLEVSGCDSLTSLPDIEGLESLRKLVISLCDNTPGI